MAGLMTGTVTFLFTDVEGSTALWERHAAAMRAVAACILRIDPLPEQHARCSDDPSGQHNRRERR